MITHFSGEVWGQLASLDIPGRAAALVSAIAMVEKQEIKRAWKQFRPDQIVGISREIEDLITGKKDWVSTFFLMKK